MHQLPLYKVAIVGDENVGKTSLVRRYCDGLFETSRITTIGVDFQTKIVKLPTGLVKLSIWDMAGQARFEIVRSGFYRGTRATALVYDLGMPSSLEHLQRWYDEARANSNCHKYLLVGNKADLCVQHDDQETLTFAHQIGAELVITSAATAEGVDTMFQRLAELADAR